MFVASSRKVDMILCFSVGRAGLEMVPMMFPVSVSVSYTLSCAETSSNSPCIFSCSSLRSCSDISRKYCILFPKAAFLALRLSKVSIWLLLLLLRRDVVEIVSCFC
jgi:hypothetical protein